MTDHKKQQKDPKSGIPAEEPCGSTIIRMPDRDTQYRRAEYVEYPEYSAHSGNAENIICPVFPGIELLYQNETFWHGTTTAARGSSLMGIYYCREGRMECRLRDSFCHIEPGDLLIAPAAEISQNLRISSQHYQGISVLIDTDRTPRCLSCFLEDVTVYPRTMAKKFCREGSRFIARGNPSIVHIFSELYSVPPQIRKGYLKLKVLELLLFLSTLDAGQEEAQQRSMAKIRVDLAQQVCRYLTSHMEEHVTLEQLSNRFHVSGTYIRSSFKNVYGVSVYSFIRARKMESAAYMLEHTDKSILEIAGAHGYDNSSKFASAFRDVMGMSPREYRSLRCCSPSCVKLHRHA